MTELPYLKQLTDEAKDSLILTLWEALKKLQKKRPKKTSKNSSLPPAKGFKAQTKGNAKESAQKQAGSLGREGGGQTLSEKPDQITKATLRTGQECGEGIADSFKQLLKRYDKIDIPPITPIGIRILAALRRSHLMCSEETSARVNGQNQWKWIFQNEQVYFHIKCCLYRDFKSVLALSLTQQDGIRLQNRYLAFQNNLFLFLDNSTIPPTNNASDQALRCSVIFRKIAKHFRSNWGKDFLQQFGLLSRPEDNRDFLLLRRFRLP